MTRGNRQTVKASGIHDPPVVGDMFRIQVLFVADLEGGKPVLPEKYE
jgi:hypothetical protein